MQRRRHNAYPGEHNKPMGSFKCEHQHTVEKKKKGDQYNRGQITKAFQKMQDEKHETIREVGKNWGGFSVLVEWTNLQLISCLQMALYMKTIVLSHLIMTGPT